MGSLDQLKRYTQPPKSVIELVTTFTEAFKIELKRPWILTLEFSSASSKTLPQILRIAKRMPGFTESEDELKQPIYSVEFDPLSIDKFEIVYKKVKNWKGTLIYVNGQPMPQNTISKWLICYRDKLASLNSHPLFCWGASPFTANIFGCHRTKLRDTSWGANDGWFQIGKIGEDGKFHIDKHRIIALIIDRLKPYAICPALNPDNLKLGMSIVPDTIDPRKDNHWEYTRLSDGTAIGVQIKQSGRPVEFTPQYQDLMAIMEQKLRMGEINLDY